MYAAILTDKLKTYSKYLSSSSSLSSVRGDTGEPTSLQYIVSTEGISADKLDHMRLGREVAGGGGVGFVHKVSYSEFIY